MNILDYWPFETFRKGQKEFLLEVEKAWDHYDVIVATAPTGSGKTPVSKAIQDWQLAQGSGTAVLVPTNQLRDQAMDDYDDLVTVKKKSEYWLEKYQMTQEEFHKKIYKFGPKDSEYEQDRRKARLVGSPLIANYYTYLAHKLQRKNLIVDEAHCLLKTMQDMNARRVWRHVHGYPMMASTPAEVLAWIESKPNVIGLLAKLRNEIKSLSPATLLEFGKGYYRGEEKDCLKLIPLDVSNEKPVFWPNKTKKIVLMSATIGPEDVADMGLSKRRVCYIDMESPIPYENRRVIFNPIADMKLRVQDSSLPIIADEILKIAAVHPDKGLIHATYSIALKLKPLLEHNDRFVFHNNINKKEVYDRFCDSDPAEGKVLIGSGMEEGIDLKDDLARWQILLKCPYPSIANPAMRYVMKNNPEKYSWMTSKSTLQACGRVARGPDDMGTTYLLDSSFEMWYNNSRESLPTWFQIEGMGGT